MTTLPDNFRVCVLETNLSLSDELKRDWRDLMLVFGDRQGVCCAAHPATASRWDGKAHVITFAMNSTPTEPKAVTKLAAESNYTEEQIDAAITLINFEGATPADRLSAFRAWRNDLSRKADWCYEEIPAWMIPPPEEVVFEDPEGPFEISEPIQWVAEPEEHLL